MADRFGASSLTALLAVAGMVGLSIVGFRAYSGTPDDANLMLATDTCPLLGDSCDMGLEKHAACCPSHDVVLASDTSNGETCHHEKTECKDLKDGCEGDGKDGCCGGCGDKADCEDATKCCSEKIASANGNGDVASCSDNGDKARCSEKTECSDNGDKATCSAKAKCDSNGDKAATCSEKTEKASTCCSQRNN